MKKTIPALLALSMALASTTTGFAATSAAAATKIPEDVANTSYEKAVSKLLDDGIISGYKDGSFRPENSITRAEVCSVIVKATEKDTTSGAITGAGFNDMGSAQWAVEFVDQASQYGIVSGYKDGTFRPSANISYNELASMLVKAAGVTSGGITGGWPEGYMNKAKELGAFDDAVDFEVSKDGTATATRGNVAIAVYNMKDKIAAAAKAGYEVVPTGDNAVVDQPEGIGYTVSNATQQFVGTPQKLSLEDAVKKMQTESVSAKTAEINKQDDKNKADGYGDSYSSIKEALKYMDNMSLEQQYSMQDSVNETSKKIVSLQRNFARENIETNYQAELNKIKQDTIKTYYGLLQATDSLRIERENLQIQKNILDTTQKKFNQGVVSKMDLLTAQNAVVKAENDVLNAENMVAQAKMGVNMLLENPLMQELQLTTSYEQLPLPTTTLTDAINSAMKSRNELVSVEFSKKVMEINYESTRVRYGTRSSKYKDAAVQMMQVEQACNTMPNNIEMDIRSRYADVHAKYDAVEAAKKTLAFAEEGYRIANVSYNAGVNTISDVQQAQVGVHSANLGLSAAIAAYNQAVYEFEIAIGIGTERISF